MIICINMCPKEFLNILKKYLSLITDVIRLGLTFKENCNDIRNSQSIKLYNHLKKNW